MAVDFFVSSSGGGSHDGTSQSNALTLSEMVTQLNALGIAGGSGRCYHICGNHTGRLSMDSLTTGGDVMSPLTLRGYNIVTGDLNAGTLDDYGNLIITGHPNIVYTAGDFRFRLVSGSYIVVQNLAFENSFNGASALQVSQGNAVVQNCYFNNLSTGVSAAMLTHQSANARFINCHTAPHPSSNGVGFNCISTATYYGCRIVNFGGIGMRSASAGVVVSPFHCIIATKRAGISIDHATSTIQGANVTIYGGTHGISITGTNSSPAHFLLNSHITDCSGYAITFNNSISGGIVTINNRYRDNGSGDLNGSQEWHYGVAIKTVSTDAGDATSDYTSPTNYDFKLLNSAAGYQGGLNKINIGACGSDTTIINSGSGGESSYVFG